MKIAAIETRYAGCRFRSRLEARYAVLFDALGIIWEYEPQGFLVNGKPYLPDFWLPETETWVEVKGDEESFQKQLPLYSEALTSGALPGVADSCGSTRGLLILGPIPRVERGNLPLHMILQAEAHVNLWSFGATSKSTRVILTRWCTEGRPGLPPQHEYTFAKMLRSSSSLPDGLRHFAYTSALSAHVCAAYIAARSARFEHGEQG